MSARFLADPEDQAASVLKGNRRAVARLITHIENNTPSALLTLGVLFSHTGRAHLIGVTGAPGTGKSTLVNQIALHYRQRGQSVAIVAVDPTSPFSGGAILGDRIRMRDLSGDSGVFIRSMASRGSLGGLARATANVTRVLDAAGFDVVLIETVGAGQSEVDIARLAQTVLVIEAPNLGDDIQAIKAGILEIADILVVNKADDPRSKHTERALRGMLDIGHKQATMAHHGQLMEAILPPEFNELDNLDFWNVPICLTVATDGSGVNDLLDRIEEHRTHLKASGELDQRTRTRAATELEMLLRDRLLARLLDGMSPEQINGLVDRVARRELLPHLAVEELVNGTRLQMDK